MFNNALRILPVSLVPQGERGSGCGELTGRSEPLNRTPTHPLGVAGEGNNGASQHL